MTASRRVPVSERWLCARERNRLRAHLVGLRRIAGMLDDAALPTAAIATMIRARANSLVAELNLKPEETHVPRRRRNR